MVVKRILIVEDDHEWLGELQRFLRLLLENEAVTARIDPTTTKQEALEKLRRAREQGQPYDLLSLDINLGVTLSADGTARQLSNGRDVLTEAHLLKACHAAMIVTGVGADQEIDQICIEDKERIVLRAGLPAILDKMFPNERGLYLPKDLQASPQQNINGYLGSDIAGAIKNICRPRNEFRHQGAGWKMIFVDVEAVIGNDRSGALRAIARLLEPPHHSFAFHDLFANESPTLTESQQDAVNDAYRRAADPNFDDDGDTLGFGGGGQLLSDARYQREALEALKRLEQEKEDIESFLAELEEGEMGVWSPEERLEKREQLQQKLEEVERQICDIQRYSGVKKVGDEFRKYRNTQPADVERYVAKCKKALRDCIKKLEQHYHPALGAHLRQALDLEGPRKNPGMGWHVVYRPRTPIEWFVKLDSDL